ncbi:TlpA disulfide reductase family protein [Paenibacillus sp. JX-17]|uniref:TlpA disulfide reductase family protein n=1 Tax=Paenibacillus lacisoli TaxID=3064525 RepID=A0ABT9C9T8_9BACL|nr:TlpA disulfide reductase family protein [Paenibacillus sp. JX-17]MDO7906001.1 TlpA disulfide reductase family protein [Paenibacillus sp. JX-17]
MSVCKHDEPKGFKQLLGKVLRTTALLSCALMFTAEVSAAAADVPALQNAMGEGLPAPSFTLKGLDSKPYSVGGRRDKPLIINFWASWCGPCRQEAPLLQKLAKTYHNQLDVYAVNVTQYDQIQDAADFTRSFGYTMPVLLDTKGDVFGQYQGAAFPTTILVDRNGIVVSVMIGSVSEARLMSKLTPLIEEPEKAEHNNPLTWLDLAGEDD